MKDTYYYIPSLSATSLVFLSYLLVSATALISSSPIFARSIPPRRCVKNINNNLNNVDPYPVPPSIIPTPAQIRYQKNEIIGLTHFNMATFFENGDPGCTEENWNLPGNTGSSNPSSFAPTNLNISNWIESYKNLGVQSAMLTAKHGCGFFIFHTENVTLPNNTIYPYQVSADLDVVKYFAGNMTAAGLGFGFYYSLTNNFYLNAFSHYVRNSSTLIPNQANVTQEEYQNISLAAVRYLWSTYPNLSEIWLDGGYANLGDEVNELLQTYQPNTWVMNGGGIATNPARWSGCECTSPPGYPTIFSTICDPIAWGPGQSPNTTCAGGGTGYNTNTTTTPYFIPSATDLTLLAGDVWFWQPNLALRSFTELQYAYHQTVGANTVIEIDFAIDRTGNVDPTHAALYKQWGEWIRQCYGTPLSQTIMPSEESSIVFSISSSSGGSGAVVDPLSSPVTTSTAVIFDRMILEEDQSEYGQCVYGYTVETRDTTSASSTWSLFASSLTIGNKRIHLTDWAINVTDVRLNVTGSMCANNTKGPITLSYYTPLNCQVPQRSRVRYLSTSSGGCLAVPNSTSFANPPCYGIECPVYLDDCRSPGTLWNDATNNTFASWLQGADSTVINVDCDNCAPHTLVKLLQGTGSPANITFIDGMLQFTCADPSYNGPLLCLNDGSGTPIRACGGDPPFQGQIQIDVCGNPGTTGWARIPDA